MGRSLVGGGERKKFFEIFGTRSLARWSGLADWSSRAWACSGVEGGTWTGTTAWNFGLEEGTHTIWLRPCWVRANLRLRLVR